MSESNNNIPMRITQLEEATAYEEGMYYAVAKAGSGTKKIEIDIPPNYMIENSLFISKEDLSTGKYFNLNSSTGKYELVENASSYYTENPIDVSNYKTITIRFNEIQSSSSRCFGFVDAQGNFLQSYKGANMIANAVLKNGLYEITLNVISDFFVFSCATSMQTLIIKGYNFNFCTSAESDKIENYVGIKNESEERKNTHLISSISRLKSDIIPINEGDVIQWNGLSGYQTVLMICDAYYNASITIGSWSEQGSSYKSDGSHPFAILYVKKSDGTNFTNENNIYCIENYKIQIKRKTLFESLNKTAYVATTGSDSNSGFDRTSPFLTIQKAINSGAKNILVKEGTYTSGFTLAVAEGVTISLDHYYDTYTAGSDEDNPKIIIDGSQNSLQNGVGIQHCLNCNIANLEIKNMSVTGMIIHDCENLNVNDCVVHDIGVSAPSNWVGGIKITNTDGNFKNCVAYNIGTDTRGIAHFHCDGFNIHGTGTTHFINCKAWNCEDDGISHHDACCGLIDGGEWYNCGKGGIASPTHGATINVQNAYCHHNFAGIYAASESTVVTDRGNIIFSNCVCVNNSNSDLYIGDYYKIIAINCVYSSVTGSENITNYKVI